MLSSLCTSLSARKQVSDQPYTQEFVKDEREKGITALQQRLGDLVGNC